MQPKPPQKLKRRRRAPLEFAAPFLHLRVAYHAVLRQFVPDGRMQLDDVNSSITEILSQHLVNTPGYRQFPGFSIVTAAADGVVDERTFDSAVDAFAADHFLKPRSNLGDGLGHLSRVWGYDIAHYFVAAYESIGSIGNTSPVRFSEGQAASPSLPQYGCVTVLMLAAVSETPRATASLNPTLEPGWSCILSVVDETGLGASSSIIAGSPRREFFAASSPASSPSYVAPAITPSDTIQAPPSLA